MRTLLIIYFQYPREFYEGDQVWARQPGGGKLKATIVDAQPDSSGRWEYKVEGQDKWIPERSLKFA